MLGATMLLIYMRDRTMTKQACDVGSHGGMFCYDWVLSEEGKTSKIGRSTELTFVQRDWS